MTKSPSRFPLRLPQTLNFHKRQPPVGARPGTLAPSPEGHPPVIHLMTYGLDEVIEREVTDVEELRACLDGEQMSWIDLQGLGDEATLRRIGEIFQLHPLALEDAVNIPQRPKSESYALQHLFITRMTRLAQGSGLDTEQVSIFIGPHYVLTLQERYGDVFDPVRRRVRGGKGLLRKQGSDYLAYALIDTVIDGYYPVIEAIGDRLHELEEEILENPTHAGLQRIHRIRRDLLALRRAVWPQREAVNSLIREESPLIGDLVRQYLRDSHDHAVQIADVIETYRELAASLMDIYLSSMSQRTNEVMKVLTIMASIFIPLTFLAGIYGMNFEYLPELKFHNAYPTLLTVMALTTAGMLYYFWRKGWIWEREAVEDDEIEPDA
ncbi:MAG: magnesium/cobalt transporter CorA [Gemmatimonadaceae bacterium]